MATSKFNSTTKFLKPLLHSMRIPNRITKALREWHYTHPNWRHKRTKPSIVVPKNATRSSTIIMIHNRPIIIQLPAKSPNRVPFRNLLPNRVPFVIIYLGALFFYYKVVPLKALPVTQRHVALHDWKRCARGRLGSRPWHERLCTRPGTWRPCCRRDY